MYRAEQGTDRGRIESNRDTCLARDSHRHDISPTTTGVIVWTVTVAEQRHWLWRRVLPFRCCSRAAAAAVVVHLFFSTTLKCASAFVRYFLQQYFTMANGCGVRVSLHSLPVCELNVCVCVRISNENKFSFFSVIFFFGEQRAHSMNRINKIRGIWKVGS